MQAGRNTSFLIPIKAVWIGFIFLCVASVVQAHPEKDLIQLKKDTLLLENSRIKRTFLWNNGHLISLTIENKKNGHSLKVNNTSPDLILPGIKAQPTLTQYRIYKVQQSKFEPFHHAIEIVFSLGRLDIKRVLRLYPDCPAIVSEYAFRGVVDTPWQWEKKRSNYAEVMTAENLIQAVDVAGIVSMESIRLEGKHWKLKSVALLDNTDYFNDLIKETEHLSYKHRLYSGNILFASNLESQEGIFMIKEAPSPMAQLNYPGGDYLAEYGYIRMIGTGLANNLITTDRWMNGYSSVVGVASGDESERSRAVVDYQYSRKRYIPERDELIMANTWGDRSRDGRVSEEFILRELESAGQLGITHLQIDDGWQQGLSHGTAVATEDKKWDSWSPADWEPHNERFPNGFSRIIRSAKEKNIKLGLWFNPTKENEYASWETDADIVINLYKNYGIQYFKIDGVHLPTKRSEENLISFLTKIKDQSGGEVVFNLDATAGKRFGYLYQSAFGTVFLENRYTDWGNYYPFWTLRNVWMLSNYIPAQNLQVEFLNKWRNSGLYGDEVFAPATYDFDYLFAITMMGQPLAWFETTGLPDAAAQIAPVIKKYRQYQADLHRGIIRPLGSEPSGRSWTGFQSIQSGKGYFLFFRELNDADEMYIKTCLPAGSKLRLLPIVGDGEKQTVQLTPDSELKVTLSKVNSYVLYHYEVII